MDQIVNLKRFRQIMNLTQTKAAESIGIDQRQWNRYENGKNEIPLRYIKELCKNNKVSLDWLLELKFENEEDITINAIEAFKNEVISELEAMRDNGDLNEDIVNYTIIPKIEDIANEIKENNREVAK